MRKLVILIAMLFLASPALAIQGQQQGQIGINDQDQGQAQGQGQGQQQGQIGINEQGQSQGQIGINEQDQGQNQGQDQGQDQGQEQGQQQGQKAYGGSAHQAQIGLQGNKQASSTNVDVDASSNDDVTVYGNTWATTPSTSRKRERSMGTIFGNLGVNEEEKHYRLEHQMVQARNLVNDKVLDQNVFEADQLQAYEDLKHHNRRKKILGILPWGGEGCNVLNVCGILSW